MPKQLSAAEHLAAAKNLLAKPVIPADFSAIESHLRAISTDDPEYKEVPALLEKAAVDEKRMLKEIAAKATIGRHS